MFASRASLIAESAVVDVCGKSNGGTALRAGEQRVGSSPLLPPRGIPKLGPLGGKGRTVTYLQSPSLSFLVRRVGAVTPPSRIRDIQWGETDRTKRTWAVVAIFLRGSEIPSSPLHLPVGSSWRSSVASLVPRRVVILRSSSEPTSHPASGRNLPPRRVLSEPGRGGREECVLQ